MRITPEDLTDINLSIDYVSATGKLETPTMGLELKDTTNASITETSASIRNNAPQTYYTQNRMITGEDYNIAPLTSTQEIVKVKSSTGFKWYKQIL